MRDMPFEEPQQVDVETPNIARMYDYLLGGAANFAIDREAGETFMSGYPGITTWAQINRSFLGRAVRVLCRAGIDQFLDLGSGVPTVGNVHEIARRENPAARVAYVDIEDVAVHHARRLLEPHDQHVTVNQLDLREPQAVLTAPGVTGLLDFARPVAVLAVAILDIIAIDDPTSLIAAYRDACAPGSAFVISHSAQLAMSPEERAHVDAMISGTNTPDQHWRTHDEVAALLPGYTLLDPGVVPSAAWRPDEPITDEHAARSNAYAAVGLLP